MCSEHSRKVNQYISQQLNIMTSKTQSILDTRVSEIESLYNISQMLETGLDKRMIAILVELLEAGVHPESIAEGTTSFPQFVR